MMRCVKITMITPVHFFAHQQIKTEDTFCQFFHFLGLLTILTHNIIRQKFNHSDMMADIAESQEDSEKIDLKFVIGMKIRMTHSHTREGKDNTFILRVDAYSFSVSRECFFERFSILISGLMSVQSKPNSFSVDVGALKFYFLIYPCFVSLCMEWPLPK